jgi:hypothetical protein
MLVTDIHTPEVRKKMFSKRFNLAHSTFILHLVAIVAGTRTLAYSVGESRYSWFAGLVGRIECIGNSWCRFGVFIN